MSWVRIEKSHHEKYKRDFVMHLEKEERNFLINSILESFTFIKREDVERTFDQFCNSNAQPARRNHFLSSIREFLGKEITFHYMKNYDTVLKNRS